MNESALFFTCSLIEQIGRMQKISRSDVIHALGRETVARVLCYADVLHCEPLEKVASDFIEKCNIPSGNFDNISKCKYRVPDVWTIGKVYARLIMDVGAENMIVTLFSVYDSWLSTAIQRYNSDLYYQPRDYLAECWRQGKIAA